MTLENYLCKSNSDLQSSNRKSPINDILNRVNTVVDALMGFKDNFNKRMNISKLGKYLKLSASELEDTIDLILKIQVYASDLLDGFEIHKIKQGNTLYLKLKARDVKVIKRPTELLMSEAYRECFSDVLYVFRAVKKGAGFNVSNPNKELINKLLILKDRYGVLFERRENGLIYPSKIGLKLGEALFASNKANRELREVEIEGINIQFE